MDRNTAPTAIVLIDPVSSGRMLKSYVTNSGHKLVAVFTLSLDELTRAGKPMSQEERLAHCDVVLECRDVEQVFAQLQQLPYRIIAVIPASEPGVELADQLAARFGVRGNSAVTSASRRDKYEVRRAVRRAALHGPPFAACRTREEALLFAREHGLPVVVKTPKGAGAHHVFVCERLEDVSAAVDQIVAGRNIFGDPTSFALVEGFVSGRQYAVELFGDGDTIHFTSIWAFEFGKNAFDVIAFERATTITDPGELAALAPLIGYAIAVGHAVDVRWGPLLVEMRDDPVQGSALIEIGARLTGIDLPLLIRESSSFDPFEATLKAYVGADRFVMPPVRFSKTATLVFCPARGRGIVDEIRGLHAIAQLPSYVKHQLYVSPGDSVGTSSDLATIPLYVYLAHEDRAQLEDDARAVRELFGIAFR